LKVEEQCHTELQNSLVRANRFHG